MGFHMAMFLRPRFAALATKMESLVESASRDMVDQSYKRLVHHFAFFSPHFFNFFKIWLIFFYQVTVMFLVLDKIAQVDPKSRDVLLLENYAAFQNRFGSPLLPVSFDFFLNSSALTALSSTYDLASSVPTLRTFYQQASEAYDGACSRYIESVIIGVTAPSSSASFHLLTHLTAPLSFHFPLFCSNLKPCLPINWK